MATPLAEILHNIADHTETILNVLNDPGVPGDVSQRLFAHILLEEKENTAKLEEIHGAGPTLLTQKLLDHSFFIQRMLQEQAMSIDLKRELLDHFMEEHIEWRVELLGPDAPPHDGGKPAQTGGKPGVVSNFGTHQARPSHGGHSGGGGSCGGQSGHGGQTAHGGQGGQSAQGVHGAHGGHGGHSPSQAKTHGGRSEQGSGQAGQGHSGRSGGSGHSDQKGKPSTTGATKRDWTVGPLWSQGG